MMAVNISKCVLILGQQWFTVSCTKQILLKEYCTIVQSTCTLSILKINNVYSDICFIYSNFENSNTLCKCLKICILTSA